MAQQINLRTPILLAQKKYFSADTMAMALGVFVLLGGVLAGLWVWRLKESTAALNITSANYTRERDSLQATIKARQDAAAPAAAALKQELQAKREELAARQAILGDLSKGLLVPGRGHAARMRLVARSIPAQVWVTDVQADEARLEVRGFTLEPAALNAWVAALAADPLLKGQALSAVKVERAKLEGSPGAAAGPTPAASASGPQRPVWDFTLVSALASPASGPALATTGSKP
jgi:Tfp pilus assembly protein PilN